MRVLTASVPLLVIVLFLANIETAPVGYPASTQCGCEDQAAEVRLYSPEEYWLQLLETNSPLAAPESFCGGDDCVNQAALLAASGNLDKLKGTSCYVQCPCKCQSLCDRVPGFFRPTNITREQADGNSVFCELENASHPTAPRTTTTTTVLQPAAPSAPCSCELKESVLLFKISQSWISSVNSSEKLPASAPFSCSDICLNVTQLNVIRSSYPRDETSEHCYTRCPCICDGYCTRKPQYFQPSEFVVKRTDERQIVCEETSSQAYTTTEGISRFSTTSTTEEEGVATESSSYTDELTSTSEEDSAGTTTRKEQDVTSTSPPPSTMLALPSSTPTSHTDESTQSTSAIPPTESTTTSTASPHTDKSSQSTRAIPLTESTIISAAGPRTDKSAQLTSATLPTESPTTSTAGPHTYESAQSSIATLPTESTGTSTAGQALSETVGQTTTSPGSSRQSSTQPLYTLTSRYSSASSSKSLQALESISTTETRTVEITEGISESSPERTSSIESTKLAPPGSSSTTTLASTSQTSTKPQEESSPSPTKVTSTEQTLISSEGSTTHPLTMPSRAETPSDTSSSPTTIISTSSDGLYGLQDTTLSPAESTVLFSSDSATTSELELAQLTSSTTRYSEETTPALPLDSTTVAELNAGQSSTSTMCHTSPETETSQTPIRMESESTETTSTVKPSTDAETVRISTTLLPSTDVELVETTPSLPFSPSAVTETTKEELDLSSPTSATTFYDRISSTASPSTRELTLESSPSTLHPTASTTSSIRFGLTSDRTTHSKQPSSAYHSKSTEKKTSPYPLPTTIRTTVTTGKHRTFEATRRQFTSPQQATTTFYQSQATTVPSDCREPCPSDYYEGPAFCYGVTPSSVRSYRMAMKFCSLRKNSVLAGETDLRDPNVLELLLNVSETASPHIELLFVNELASNVGIETETARVVSLQNSTRFFLKVVETVGYNDRVTNVTGICKTTMYCEELTCNLNDFEFYQPSLHLVLPQNRSLAVGETIEIPCANDTSGTSIEVTCKKYGYLDPHPTTVTCQSEADKEEEQRVHSSCAECYAPGTDKCVEVSGGFVCECREHWTGLTCWKAPNQCELQQIACEHGTCESQVDQAVCKCDESFAGEHCTVNRTQLSWFSYDGSSIISVQTFSAAILFCTELALTIAYIFVDQRSELKDPQLFYQEARSFEMAIAGLVVLLYRHPAMLNLHTYECGMYFFVATSLFSVGIGLLTFEAYNGYETASLKQLNNWRVDFQLKERWSLSLGLRVLPTVIVMSGAVALVYFSMKEKVTSSWSCLGNFSSDAINFWFPLALLNTIAAIGATAFSYKGLFTRMHIPQYDKVLEAYLKTCPVHLRNDIEKCHRNLIFSALLSWMLLGCWLFLGISNDDVVEFVPNCFALMFTLLYCATDVLQFVVTTPSLYSKMMWASIRILPCHLSPSMDPVSQWSKREILASYERGNAEIKRNWYNPCRKGYLPLCVRCQIEDEWSEKYETLRMNHGNKTKASIMFVIRQDSVEYHLINEKNPAVRNTIRRLFRQWSAATYRNDPNPDASLRPKTELERQLEEIAELKRSLLFYNGPGSAEMTGWSDEPLNDNNNAKNLANEASLVLTIDCYGNTELKLVLKTPVEIIDEEDFLASSIDGRSDDFDCQEDHTSTYDDEMTLTRRRHDCLKEESETVFQMAVQNQDYLERLLSLRSW